MDRMEQKRSAGRKAVEYVKDGMVLGLGTGTTAFYMIERVGELVKEGLNIRAVATSQSTKALAEERNISIISIDDVEQIDLVIDGVDEIDPDFNAIKGGGGALFREKMVAKSAKEVIWIMDEGKRVDALGNFPLPVEILPYGYRHILKKMEDYSFHPVLRMKDSMAYVTDNGNYIADLMLSKNFDITAVDEKLRGITGVLETGLFLKICNRIIVGTEEGTIIVDNPIKILN